MQKFVLIRNQKRFRFAYEMRGRGLKIAPHKLKKANLNFKFLNGNYLHTVLFESNFDTV